MEAKSAAPGGERGAYADAEVPDKRQQQNGSGPRPGEAAASRRADVMSTKPQGRSAAHGRMSGAESATVAIQLEHPKIGRGNQKRTTHEKMFFLVTI